jgi:hypothetical protein
MIISDEEGKAVAVIGSRSLTDEKLVSDYLTERRDKIKLIISGNATGPDTFAVNWSVKFGKPFLIFPPLWRDPITNVFDRGAGFKRNALIIKNCDIVIAFWDKVSKGTANSLEIAKRLGKPVSIIEFTPKEKEIDI